MSSGKVVFEIGRREILQLHVGFIYLFEIHIPQVIPVCIQPYYRHRIVKYALNRITGSRKAGKAIHAICPFKEVIPYHQRFSSPYPDCHRMIRLKCHTKLRDLPVQPLPEHRGTFLADDDAFFERRYYEQFQLVMFDDLEAFACREGD